MDPAGLDISAISIRDSDFAPCDHVLSHRNSQARRDQGWSTSDIRAMIRIFETYAGPFAVGTVAELLNRANYPEVGKWIILYRQSAHALSVAEKRRFGARGRSKIAPCCCQPIACPIGGGVMSVIGGVDDVKLRLYLDGTLTGAFGLQLPETDQEALGKTA